MPAKRKTSPKAIEETTRKAQAMEMRTAGYTYEEISTALGYASTSGAYDAVKAGLHDMLAEPSKACRRLHLRRLERLLRGVWKKAEVGDPVALDRSLKILRQIADLKGLDAPKRVQADVTARPADNKPEELSHDDLDREARRILQQRMGGSCPAGSATPAESN